MLTMLINISSHVAGSQKVLQRGFFLASNSVFNLYG